MENVVIYARYSSHGQTEQSIEGQMSECYAFAKRNGYNVVHEYIDRALSGTSDKRVEFQNMIEDSKKKAFKYVLVYQLDRFARDRYDSATYKHKLKKNGVRVISVKENISADASGILMESILEGMAEYYSVELAQKVKRGKLISAEKCKHLGGKVPFGFKVNGELKYEIDEENAPWVVKAFEMYADGTPARHIMYMLNENHIKNVHGKEWTKNTIHNMLKNKKYNGYYVYLDKEIKGGMPQIISDDLFKKVAMRINKNKEAPARGRAKVPYILTTKLFCGKCDRSMVGVSGTSKLGVTHHYYKCLSNHLHEGCTVKAVKKDLIESAVIEEVKKTLTDELISYVAIETEKALAQEKGNDNVQRLKKLLTETKASINNLLDTLAKGRNTDLIMDKIDELKETQCDLEYKIAKEESILFKLSATDIAKFLTTIRDSKTNDIKDMQRFVDTFIYRVFYYEDGKISILINMSSNRTENILPSDIEHLSEKEQEKRTHTNLGSYKSSLAES